MHFKVRPFILQIHRFLIDESSQFFLYSMTIKYVILFLPKTIYILLKKSICLNKH